MNIAFLGWGLVNTGGNRVIGEHANRLIEAGHKVDLYFHFGEDPIFMPLKPRVIYTKPFENQALLEKKYDIVIATSWVSIYELKELRIPQQAVFFQHWDPYVYRQDDTKSQLALNGLRLKCPKYTVSKWLVDMLQAECNQDALMVPNGIDCKEIQHALLPKKKKNKKPKIGILSSTYAHFKGLGFASLVVMALKKLDPKLEFILVSNKDTPYADCFDRFISRPSQPEKYKLIQSFDVLLHTSEYEGMGLVPLEAMACGTPVVLTDSLGINEYVHSKNAVKISTRKPTLMANVVMNLLHSPSKQANLVEAGLKTAQQRDWNLLFQAIEAVYLKLATT